jgi:hypothetical protein
MFELDQAVAEWRQRMIAGGIKSPVPLDELENHLREDIQNQILLGATAEQAFATAAKQMGDAHGLNREFEKVSEESPKRKRMRAASIVGGTAFAYAAVFGTWIFARRAGKFEITITESFFIFGSMAATIFFGFMGRHAAKFLPAVTDLRLQSAATVAAFFLGTGLLRLVWGCLTPDSLVHTQIVLLWTMSPILGFGHCLSAWCNRCSAARRQLNAVNA